MCSLKPTSRYVVPICGDSVLRTHDLFQDQESALRLLIASLIPGSGLHLGIEGTVKAAPDLPESWWHVACAIVK
jgi:hypothetical protein